MKLETGRVVWGLVLIIFFGVQLEGDNSKAVSDGVPATLSRKPDGPNIFGVLAHESDVERSDFVEFYSRYQLVVISNYDERMLKLRELAPEILLIGMPSPYFHWDPEPEKTVPDQILRDENRNPIRYNGPLYFGMSKDSLPVMMDIRNKQWQETFLVGCRALVDEYKLDGVLMDTWSTECPEWAFQDEANPPASYQPEKWKDDMLEFTELARRRLGRNTLFLFNGVGSAPPSRDLGDVVYLPKADGTCSEAYSIYLSIDESDETRAHYFFHTVMEVMKHVKDTGKYYLLQVSGSEDNKKTRLYALASFLLLQYDKSYFYYDQGDEDEPNWFPEWNISLGQPLGEFQTNGKLYYREFENVTVWVNPTNSPVEIPGDGKSGRIRLPSFSGKIIARD